MKVLVTGATGFLGSALARALAERGDEVSVLVRSTSNCAPLRGIPVQTITGDVQDRASLDRAVSGNDVVMHCAGKVEDWGKRQQFFQINVEGTRNLLEASCAAGIKHFIHTSSLTVLGIPRGTPIDETTPYTKDYFEPYTETKIISEQLVLDFHHKHRLPVTIIRPGVIWGPGDTTILPRLERFAKKGLIFNIGRGDNILCLSYISNLVDGFLLAADSGRGEGQIYHVIDDEKITSRTFFAELSATVGVKKPAASLPFSLMYGIAYCFEAIGKLLKFSEPPLLTRLGLCLWGCDCNYDITRTRQQLGYKPRVSFNEGVKRVSQWYCETRSTAKQ
jgi:nucleoside-diphosphate-sugar epimerase